MKVIVIGGGTAGLRTSLALAKSVQVILIEPGVLGGTCLNTGCIPTKAMLHASHSYKKAQEMAKFGITCSPKVNFTKLMSRVNSFPEKGQVHIQKSIKKYDNLSLIKGKAVFVNKNTVRVGNKKYSADKVIICTGSTNFIPPIRGLTNYLDNESILRLKKLPKSVIMVGGGYISMEFATFFNDLGSKVTVLELLPNILTMLDDDIIEIVNNVYKEKGVDIITNAKVTEIKDKVYYEKDGKISSVKAGKIFVATGRKPNTKYLNLEAAGINTGKHGEIIVNDYLETSNNNVYALGDCIGKAMFAHACKRESKLVVNSILNNKKEKMPFSLVPWAVFLGIPIAGVGLNEKEAKKKKIAYEIMSAKFSRTGRASIIDEPEGFVKILHSKGKILGCTIIGENADDIIHEIVAVMNSNGKVDSITKAIHIHPTLSEVMENLK